ncbi:MAG: hypothetical protein HUJ30_09570 [Gammaproteobacteria bacterium]|nr:hypothetical protein [Gammaproteobacteria bacterium]
MSVIDSLVKQLGVLVAEDIDWQNPHLKRAVVAIRVPQASRAYRDFSQEENDQKAFKGLEKFEQYYRS